MFKDRFWTVHGIVILGKQTAVLDIVAMTKCFLHWVNGRIMQENPIAHIDTL